MNIDGDDSIPLSRVPRTLSATYPVSYATVTRWRLKGVGHPRVRLAATKIGGRWYTTPAALDEFITAVTRQSQASCPEVNWPTHRRSRRVATMLDDEGIR